MKNLVAEMARIGITRSEMAKFLGITLETFTSRVRNNKFYLADCIKMRDTFFPEYSLEYLFEVD